MSLGIASQDPRGWIGVLRVGPGLDRPGPARRTPRRRAGLISPERSLGGASKLCANQRSR
ncbi:hypothetical protein [Kibdelosporangium philippinense]|uniref:hypothetical protein n=1 Tax=Kibdelosporangium philippinense TaxID=211113 RepID=UPI00361624A7